MQDEEVKRQERQDSEIKSDPKPRHSKKTMRPGLSQKKRALQLYLAGRRGKDKKPERLPSFKGQGVE